MKVKVTKPSPEHALDHLLSTEPEDLDSRYKIKLVEKEFRIAQDALPDYNKLTEELLNYEVKCPSKPEITDFSQINELYAISQSLYSRTTAVLMLATDNFFRWKRICNLMKDYILDIESEMLLTEECRGMKNKMQEAFMRTKFKKQYQTLAKLEFKLSKAESFKRTVEAKKEDLSAILTTLSKQVKALSVEKSLTNYSGRA